MQYVLCNSHRRASHETYDLQLLLYQVTMTLTLVFVFFLAGKPLLSAYPPGLQKVLEEKQDFAQLEDFNKRGKDKAALHIDAAAEEDESD